MEPLCCQNCGASTVIAGPIWTGSDWGAVDFFVPASTRYGVKLRLPFRSCWSCGHVWASVAPKLALFGWRPKGKIDDDDSALQDHPMRDRELDG
jgi:hypothetical protein